MWEAPAHRNHARTTVLAQQRASTTPEDEEKAGTIKEEAMKGLVQEVKGLSETGGKAQGPRAARLHLKSHAAAGTLAGGRPGGAARIDGTLAGSRPAGGESTASGLSMRL